MTLSGCSCPAATADAAAAPTLQTPTGALSATEQRRRAKLWAEQNLTPSKGKRRAAASPPSTPTAAAASTTNVMGTGSGHEGSASTSKQRKRRRRRTNEHSSADGDSGGVVAPMEIESIPGSGGDGG